MKIAIVLPWGGRFSPDASPGAIELTVKDFVAHSRFRDSTTVIGNPPVNKGQVFNPFDICRFRSAGPNVIRQSRADWHAALIRTLGDIRPDLIQVQQSPHTTCALKTAFPKTPVLLHRHDCQFSGNPVKSYFLRRRIRSADFIVCNSNFTRDQHSRRTGIGAHAIQRIYNGLDFSEFGQSHEKERLIVCVAARMPRKGPEIVASALAPILERNKTWRAVMVCATSGSAPKSYCRAVEGLFAELGARHPDGRFRRLEAVPHRTVMDLYERAAIAVIPSQWDEGFGRTALEAVASKAAVVSSGRGGLLEVTGPHGIYPASQMPEAYADAIQQLIDRPDERREQASVALERGRLLFDATVVATEFDDVMARLMAPPRGPY